MHTPTAPSGRPVSVDLDEEEEVSLSPLEESDLLKEIAKLKLEEDMPVAEYVSPAERAAEADRRSRRAAKTARSQREISRLLGEANTKLDGEESRRRLAAITHLKAAVAATVAERKLTAGKGPEILSTAPKTMERFRDDLSKVEAQEKPTRPAGKEAGKARAKAEAAAQAEVGRPTSRELPAPPLAEDLKGVEAAPPPAARVQEPRTEIASGGVDHTGTEPAPEVIAAFAVSRGAVTLTDFVEAVAAFAIHEKGMESFLRPYLLSRVEAVVPEGTYTPELGLRAFGTLLRSGTIQKVDRGRFTISDASRFLQIAS